MHNPMREPMLARDAEALKATLAEDVVLHSPIIEVPFLRVGWPAYPMVAAGGRIVSGVAVPTG